MTQRERILAIAVGGMLVMLAFWWGFDKYRTAIKQRTNKLATLDQDQMKLREQILQGHLADRQMTEYMLRSLPGNAERARSVYQQWLLETGLKHKIDDLNVDPTTAMPVGDLYQRLSFRVSGKGSMPDLSHLLYDFYSKDYLHLIRELTIRKVKNQEDLTIEMSIDAIALLETASDAKPPEGSSWRVRGDVAAYRDPIMNRNFFEPPNGAPLFGGSSEVEAIVGRDSPIPLAAKDPEGDQVVYEFVEPPPSFVRLDSRSGTLHVNSDQLREFTLQVRATDDGYPTRSTELELKVSVVQPPAPPPAEPPKLAFDDSTQTVLTGLVHGRDDWTAWMHVRTKDTTLKLRVGDQFEIGSLKGKVIEVAPKFVELEIEGRRFTLKPNGILKEAADRAQED
jgi:hypothetical protein